MDTTVESEETPVVRNSFKHEFGKTLVSASAAYGASKLADVVYDKVLAAVRARKAR